MIFAVLLIAAAPSTGFAEKDPVPAISSLPGGGQLIVREKHGVPWTSFRLGFRMGGARDPSGKSGLARVAGLVLASAVANASSSDEPRLLARLGVELEVTTELESTILAGGVADDHLEAALAELFRALAALDVSEPVLRAAIDRAIAERRGITTSDRALAELEMRRQLLRGRDPHGEIEQLATITLDDTRALLKQHVRQGAITLAFATARRDLSDLAAKWIATLPAGRAPESAPEPLAHAAAPKGRRIVIVDKPGRQDAELLFGRSAPAATDKRMPAMLAANAILGGTFSSRLNRAVAQIRASRPPIASSWIDHGAFGVAVSASPEDVAHAIRTVLEQLGRIAFEGLDAPELAFGRRHAAARVVLDARDATASIDTALSDVLAGLPIGAHALLAQGILAATDRDIDSAARTLANSDEAVIVIVASATPSLQRELAAVPGVRSVSIVGYEDR